MPTAAAAALVVTATGASFADPSGLHLNLSGDEAALARLTATDRANRLAQARIDERSQQIARQATALEDRLAAEQRASRDQARAALVGHVAATARAQARADAIARAKAAAVAAAHRWIFPIDNPVMTSDYGYRWGKLHAGDDFAVPVGTPLRAMSTGEVIFAGYQSGYGYKVEIRYWEGTVSYYGHMSRIIASVGTEVAPGTVVGYSGNTGHSTGPHLHLEIHPDGGAAIDPYPWLVKRGLL